MKQHPCNTHHWNGDVLICDIDGDDKEVDIDNCINCRFVIDYFWRQK